MYRQAWVSSSPMVRTRRGSPTKSTASSSAVKKFLAFQNILRRGKTGMSEPDRSRNCPSGRSVVGASLIGIIGKDGRLGYLREEIPVDEVFLTMVQARSPLRRFRFSEPCVESRCSQWTGTRCGLIDEILDG